MVIYCGLHYGQIKKMNDMFNQKKAKPENIRYLKDIISKKLNLPETTILSIAELSCHEPGCPPKETVITTNANDGTSKTWKIEKPIDQIDNFDVENLLES